MIILGIDPGIAIMGYGIISYIGNRFEVISYGAITTDSKTPTPERLKKIYRELNELIEKYKPEAIAVEELFFNTNAKTALLVGHARGVAVLAAANNEKEIFEYTPLQVKQGVVGYGRAEKHQVQQMIKTILNLDKIPKPDDVADALAVAVCHAHSGNFKDLFRLK
ncbi:crossover junction endodeoxyribonuclease RuvC [Natronincola ferrireducens]|uniref:Crossover junction endodeoxyribonuclease RuvC n=1 Tax=Natronincola ferrireducens TaxID=393762 RepID=A0A1G9CYL3_9FIRM|nr:crossover junction endodeoxyribonuclease RuvC [Natronincola ferrireducens]SDK56722.1 Holliday junction endonuclease RuvC [Natronincola ferrireducens]